MQNRAINKSERIELSERQRRILRYIYDHQRQHGFPPTLREIGKATDTGSTSVINYNVDRLVEYGLLARRSDISRSLTLQAEGYRMLGKALPENDEVRQLWAKVAALESENLHLHEENRRLVQRLNALKQTVISRVEAVFG